MSTFNFHGGPAATYSPITLAGGAAGGGLPQARPLYYAMLAMAELSGRGNELVAVALATSNPRIKAWATRAPGGGWHAVLIHKDPATSAPAAVTVVPPTPASAPGVLSRLLTTSPLGVLARWNITWRGQTFDGSADGRPVGPPVQWHKVWLACVTPPVWPDST